MSTEKTNSKNTLEHLEKYALAVPYTATTRLLKGFNTYDEYDKKIIIADEANRAEIEAILNNSTIKKYNIINLSSPYLIKTIKVTKGKAISSNITNTNDLINYFSSRRKTAAKEDLGDLNKFIEDIKEYGLDVDVRLRKEQGVRYLVSYQDEWSGARKTVNLGSVTIFLIKTDIEIIKNDMQIISEYEGFGRKKRSDSEQGYLITSLHLNSATYQVKEL